MQATKNFLGGISNWVNEAKTENDRKNLFDFKPKELVYAVQSQAFPELLKVGKTKNSMKKRLVNLNTSMAHCPFSVVSLVSCIDSSLTEKTIHSSLADYHTTKEFFKIPVYQVVQILNEQQKIEHNKMIQDFQRVQCNRLKLDVLRAWKSLKPKDPNSMQVVPEKSQVSKKRKLGESIKDRPMETSRDINEAELKSTFSYAHAPLHIQKFMDLRARLCPKDLIRDLEHAKLCAQVTNQEFPGWNKIPVTGKLQTVSEILEGVSIHLPFMERIKFETKVRLWYISYYNQEPFRTIKPVNGFNLQVCLYPEKTLDSISHMIIDLANAEPDVTIKKRSVYTPDECNTKMAMLEQEVRIKRRQLENKDLELSIHKKFMETIQSFYPNNVLDDHMKSMFKESFINMAFRDQS